eukprot:2876024-Rhodomonas_salina.4
MRGRGRACLLSSYGYAMCGTVLCRAAPRKGGGAWTLTRTGQARVSGCIMMRYACQQCAYARAVTVMPAVPQAEVAYQCCADDVRSPLNLNGH